MNIIEVIIKKAELLPLNNNNQTYVLKLKSKLQGNHEKQQQ